MKTLTNSFAIEVTPHLEKKGVQKCAISTKESNGVGKHVVWHAAKRTLS